MTGKRHCIVIGAGTVGSCCAWQLQRDGFQVTLVDREQPGQATSFGNAACLSPSQIVPYSYPGVWKKLPGWLADELGPMTVRWRHLPWVAPWLWRFWRAGTAMGVERGAAAQAALMHRVRDDFDALLQRAGLSHYLVSKGLIVVYDRREHFESEQWSYDIEERYGFNWEHLGPAELNIMAPALDIGEGMAIYLPSWQHTLDPARMTAGIAEHAVAQGAEWVNEEVSSVSANGQGVQVQLSGGRTLEADHLVVAAGPWSNQLAAQLDRRVPLGPKRGYHSMLGAPGIELDYPVLSGSRLFVMTPLQDGLRVAGTAEFARLDAEPNYDRAKVLVKHAQHYFPGLQTDEVSEWMGQRPMMADSVPVISSSPRHPNVTYAFGHGHYGLTQGPTTGVLVSALARGAEAPIDMNPYRFDRF